MPTPALRPTESIAGLFSSGDSVCKIRHPTAADESFCRSLFSENRAAQFAPLGLDENVLHAMLDQQFDAQRTSYARQFPNAETFIVAHAGVAVGRIILTLQQSPPVSNEAIEKASPDGLTLHMIDITIAAAARGRGIGSGVIDRLARVGHALGATRFTLSVLRTNDAARQLYERLGFVRASGDVHVLMVRHLD